MGISRKDIVKDLCRALILCSFFRKSEMLMCGICGIVGKCTSENDMRGMLDAIAHRGPDDEGVYKEDNIFLGHRRLSILDLSPLGHQPMLYENYVIVFNGEIFNYIELRNELKEKGHFFGTGTDTEVILHGYAEWGNEIFGKLRGMWALALYDKSNKKIIFSRDRFGIKPFYYFSNDDMFVFASEIPVLLAAGVSAEVNYDVVMRYLAVGCDDNGKDSFFKDIHQLPGGCNIEYDLHTKMFSIVKYYDLASYTSSHDGEKSLEDVFDETLLIHLRSDVKIGSCLSGGLDSSTLTGAIQHRLNEGGQRLSAVTAKSELKENDESELARQVAAYSGMDWYVVCPGYNDFLAYHQEMLRRQAEPVGSPSVFMQYCVMKKARECGIKVMFDGQGGDETLLGYERYYVTYIFSLFKSGKLVSAIRAYKEICKNSKLTILDLMKYILYFGCLPVRKCVLRKRLHFIKQEYMEKLFIASSQYLKQSKDMLKLQIDEITDSQLPHLLKYEDRNSMHFSIEARCPYVDHVYVENAINLPFEMKVAGGWTKKCLRHLAERFIPESIAWRKNKFGFEAPEKIWLERYLPVMQEYVDDSELIRKMVTDIPDMSKLSLRLRWRLYNLAVWEEQYLN